MRGAPWCAVPLRRGRATPRAPAYAAPGRSATVTTSSSSANTTSGIGGPPRTAPSCRRPSASSRAPGPILATSGLPPLRPARHWRSRVARRQGVPTARARRACQSVGPGAGGIRTLSRRRALGQTVAMPRRPYVAGLVVTPGASAGREHSGLVAIETAVAPLGIAVERRRVSRVRPRASDAPTRRRCASRPCATPRPHWRSASASRLAGSRSAGAPSAGACAPWRSPTAWRPPPSCS